MERGKYYLGLDIGTDSVGYAVTDKEYNLLKFHGEPAWGVTVFDEAALCDERRSFRSSRRRLDRRQQRVTLIQELFAPEIAKTDERFFIRLKESALYRDDVADNFTLFSDDGFTDKEYYKLYPTIHHLISDLMESNEPHDVRLVYLATAWLVAHRGHFLNNIDKNNLDSIKDFDLIYKNLSSYFTDNGYAVPWPEPDIEALGSVLKKKLNITNKYKELCNLFYGSKKPSKLAEENFPFSRDAILRLLAGGSVKLKDLFDNDEYTELGSVALGMDEEKFSEIMGNIGDDYELIDTLRAVYDWSVLVDTLGEAEYISKAKIKIYEQHKKDLEFLKLFIKKYKPEKYNEIFRDKDKDNYTAYSYHSDDGTAGLKKKNKELFFKYLLGIVKGITPDKEDSEQYCDMINRLELRTFMPKQKDTDNRVIPHQLYWYELHCILQKAASYLPFLTEKDENSLTVSEKIESVFLFRIPYFVGPLNNDSDNSWLVRKAGRIYPWNFEEMVDLDESENRFIKRMTNKCTYLPGEDVLPKDSLLYHKFSVLNTINNLRINGEKISVELKQRIYNEVFMVKKKVTLKQLTDYLIRENYIEKGQENLVSGVDTGIGANLLTHIAFKNLLTSGVISQEDAEKIIERASYAEDKTRLSKWLSKNYPHISEVDRKYICSIKIKDFGRLSRKFLQELEGVDKSTGEVTTVISAMWNTQNNLMEIIADEEKYNFAQVIRDYCREYYNVNKLTLSQRLDNMYISNAVRRPIYRTLDIVKDVVKAFGEPEKIFIEMTRGANEAQKGKRTKTRKQQILELYDKCKDEDVRLLKQQLEALGDYADNKLQGEQLFLYFMQLGKSMYSDTPIQLEMLGTEKYNVDHIYPQAYVKDDSINNNKVLVLSTENGAKGDDYPIVSHIQHNMKGHWDYLHEKGLISDEKYKRLIRATPFTDEEKFGFINRQLTETSQSTKAVAQLINEKYPETEIVYSKARLASEFRQEFGIYKSRTFNDLHHAVDAYLNIVVGNVYQQKFTKHWFSVDSKYSIKTKTIFTHPLVCSNETIWDGEKMLVKVKKTAVKNNAHFTRFAYFKKGGLFDQMPVSASEGLVPLKKGLPTEKYGGYNKAGVMFYIPVRYKAGKKSDIIIMSVELLFGKRFLEDIKFAEEYTFVRLKQILGKDVDEISFPMGMRPWKVNTVLSLDGLRYSINGTGNKGASLLIQIITQFSADPFWKFYLKKLEEFVKKISANANYIYSEQYDKVSAEKNFELYCLYIDKLKNSVYKSRRNSPLSILENGADEFKKLSIKEQAKTLLAIQSIFGRLSGGCDLQSIGGQKMSAKTTISTGMSNWKKDYSDVRIIDSSASGLWEKESCNLLELL